jgi:hypothetical protein
MLFLVGAEFDSSITQDPFFLLVLSLCVGNLIVEFDTVLSAAYPLQYRR